MNPPADRNHRGGGVRWPKPLFGIKRGMGDFGPIDAALLRQGGEIQR